MELTVKSLQGSYLVSGLNSEATIADLKRLLHQQHKQQVPEPEEQCLVYKHSVLSGSDVVLQQLGITHGDQLVMLTSRPAIKRPRAQTTPAADTAAIRTAITEEARSRGIEHTLKEERPPVARRGLRLPAGLFGELGEGNEQIIQLIQQALEGQLPAGLQLNLSSGEQAGDAAEAGEEEQAELQIPQPPADRITQLTEMGFSDVLALNALLLHRSNVEAALEWLLEHGDDPAAAEPIPQERLRQIYGRRRGRAGGRGSAAGLTPQAVLSQLTDMGFEASAAQSVLSQVGPSLELAVQQLLVLGGAVSGGGAAAAGAAQAAPAASAGAGAAADAQQPGSAGGSRYQTPLPPEASEGEVGADGQQSGESAGAAAASEAEADDDEDADEDEVEDEDEDEFEDEDEDDEDDFFDNTDDALYDLPIAGTMQLANLGSADMEQLLQGANLQELTLGNQLLMPGGMDTAMAGPQATLLRLLDSPAFLEQVAAGMQALQGADQQQQQQQQQGQQPIQQPQAEQPQEQPPSQQGQGQPQGDGSS